MTTERTVVIETRFYPATHGGSYAHGKYHAANLITGTAACGSPVVLDLTASPIVAAVGDPVAKIHPIVCERCTKAAAR